MTADLCMLNTACRVGYYYKLYKLIFIFITNNVGEGYQAIICTNDLSTDSSCKLL